MKHFLFICAMLIGLTAHGQRFVKTFNTLDELLAANPNDVHTNAYVLGRKVTGDSDVGVYTYDRASTAQTNSDLVLKPVSYGGRWKYVGKKGYIPRTKYEVYSPSVTLSVMLDPATSPWQYNHDTTIAWYGDRWYAQWNANTDKRESQPNQVILQSTSTDFSTWTTPVEVFHSGTYSENPVTMLSTDREWQPGLVRVGSELWSIWSRESTLSAWPVSYKLYFSRLSTTTGKWVNTQLNITYTDPEGSVYYGFATQNPIQLKSGRVIAPIIWNSQDVVTPTPANWTSTSYFWINKRKAGAIYSDDNGVTWKLSGVTTLPGYDHSLWEPVISQSADGSVVMYCRSLDYKNFGSDKYLLWAQGYNDGASFDMLTPIRIDVSSSRLGMLSQTGVYPRTIGLHNDWQSAAGANFVAARRNAALFFSRSGAPDMVPGLNFSEEFGSVSYPQGDIHDNKIYVMWTQSQEPNYLRTSVIDPAPDVDKWYISPRRNDALNPYVVWSASPVAILTHNTISEMQSVRSTASWSDTNKVSVGAWVFKSSAGASTALQTIVDNRLLTAGQYGGFIWGSFSGVPLLSLVQTSGTGINYSFSTLTVPVGEWIYMGLTIDLSAASATTYIVRANGTATTESLALGTHAGVNGATLYVGRAINTSSWARHVGDVRRIRVLNGVAATVDQHRYWHGTEQSALSVTDWAGTETNPGAPSFDYNANDGHAGSNDATWLAEWTQTGQIYRGYASPSMVSSTNTVLITGSGSASLEMPPIGKNQQYTFSTQLFITNKTSGFDQCFLTIGDIDNQVSVISRSANSGKFEVFSKLTDTYTEIGNYIDGKWLPLTVKIGGGYATISLNRTTVQVRINEQQPRVYLGQGYLGTVSPSQLDGFHVDSDSAYFQVNDLAQQYTIDADPILRSLTIASSNAVSSISGVNPTFNVVSTGGAGFRPQINVNGSVPTISLTDSDSPTKTNHFVASGNQILLMNDLTQSGAGGIHSWDASNGDSFTAGSVARHRIYATGGAIPEFGGFRYNGTYTTPTAVQNGDGLATFGGAGFNGSFAVGYKAVVNTKATENWTTTANGSRLTFEVTPNGSTTRAIAWSIDQDSAFVHESSGRKLVVGNGSPEGVVTASIGSQYWRRDGGAGTSLYVKESGTGTATGWVGYGASGSGGVTDGDKGDITVTSSGTVWTIDNTAVTYAKMQNVSAASKLLGRGSAAGAGSPQEITIGAGLTMSGTTLTASGATVADSDYGDITVSGSGLNWDIDLSAVTYDKIQDMNHTRILGRKTGSGNGPPEEVTISDTLDWTSGASPAYGDVLYRSASSWYRLAPGTSGQFLQTQGVGASPQWATPTVAGSALTGSSLASGITSSSLTSFGTSPTLITPTIGVATATSINKVAITAPASSATLTIANGKTLTVNNTVTLSGTDSTTYTLPDISADIGFRNVPQNSQSAAYTLVLADSGKHVFHPSSDANSRTFTIPANGTVAFPVGTTITFYNASANSCTIAITTDTLRKAGTGTTGSVTLPQYALATIMKVTTTEWVISGNGI